jgi:hypothetical protein
MEVEPAPPNLGHRFPVSARFSAYSAANGKPPPDLSELGSDESPYV